MSNVVKFKTKPFASSKSQRLGPGEVIIFPGVRYERDPLANGAVGDDVPKPGKKSDTGNCRRAT